MINWMAVKNASLPKGYTGGRIHWNPWIGEYRAHPSDNDLALLSKLPAGRYEKMRDRLADADQWAREDAALRRSMHWKALNYVPLPGVAVPLVAMADAKKSEKLEGDPDYEATRALMHKTGQLDPKRVVKYRKKIDDLVAELRAKTAGDPVSAVGNSTGYVKSLQQALAEQAEDHRFDKYIPTEFAPITEDEARRIKSFQSLNNMPWRGWRNMALDSMYVPAFRYTTDDEGNFYLNNNRVVDMDGFQVYENGNRIFDNKNRLLTPNGDLALQADGRPAWDTSQYKKLNEYPDMYDFYNTYYKGSIGLLPRFGSLGPDLIKKIDPNGYLKKYGVVDPDDIEADYMSEIDALVKLRSLRAYTDYLKQNYPDDYQDYANGIGSLTDLEAPLGVDPAVEQQQKAARQAANAEKRWGSRQINLTPEQFAYWQAKRQYNANPGSDPYYQRYMNAKSVLKPNDLSQVRKYNVQQRMMSAPAANGQQKTPAQLNQEWNQENRRRQQLSNEMLNNERQGLRNRTGVSPTLTTPW